MTVRGWPIEPCPSNHEHPTADDPCDTFVSQGFGPEGDYEHSLFCRTCGWEYADHPGSTCGSCGDWFETRAELLAHDCDLSDLSDHPECLTADECEERGLDPTVMGIGPDCQSAHGERGLPHTTFCWPLDEDPTAGFMIPQDR